MTKSEIIQAAFKVWGTGFYQTTSLSTLAASLGVTKPALYHHFKNKDSLLDAMYNTYFDSLSGSINPFFGKMLASVDAGKNKKESLDYFLLLNNEITKFFANNPWYFIFTLTKVHGNMDISTRLKERGLDFEKLRAVERNFTDKNAYPPLFQLVLACSLFIIVHFLKSLWKDGRYPENVSEITQKVDEFVRRGMGFNREKINIIDWEGLEKSAAWRQNIGGGGGRHRWIIKAAASVVAAAGPCAASMSMVAKKSGLSKSGLYAHFASKSDMLRQIFSEELDGVIQHARSVSQKSDAPEEQLYLAIRAIEGFLTSEPEFLAAINNFKTMLVNFNPDYVEDMRKDNGECQITLSQIFSEIKDSSGKSLIDVTTAGVILFLLTDTLIQKPDYMEYKSIPNESFRIFYRFIALGIEGVVSY
ncbi:MAG: TetR/AcrR family transcriptional regulator [Treponema sp.]|jgi:AcrR family transcriptional regulator|nr:TetR/AcrR family transcriptional regulator [Treponema sp.]